MKSCLTLILFIIAVVSFVLSCAFAFVAGAKYGKDLLPDYIIDKLEIENSPLK